MLPAKGGTALSNKNYTDIKVSIIKTENLYAKNKISFFENEPIEQQVVDYSIESIVNALKNYGLASQDTYWYLQEGPFNGTNGPSLPYFQGLSVSISYDGSIVASGGAGYELLVGTRPFPTDDGGIGATWTFTRDTFNVWKQQQAIINNGYVNNPPLQGWSVSLSGDGNTLAIGAPNDSDVFHYTGKVYIYVKSGNSWSFQEALVPTGDLITQQSDYFGYSISLSNDGNVLVAGGPGYDTTPIFVGATWVFRRTGTSWTQDAGPIISYYENPLDTVYVGQSVDISSDGNTFVTTGVIPILDYSSVIFVYTYIGNSWIKYTQIMIEIDSVNYYLPVSISGDGNTIIFGRSTNNSIVGTVDIFVKIDGIWTYQTTLLGTGTAISQGITVSLSYDGNTAAFTGYTNEGSNLWIFNRKDDVWTQNGVEIPTAYTISTKISGDGKTIVTGSCNDQEIRIYKN